MGLGPHGVNRSAASLAAADLAEDAHLTAVRREFAGTWDILEVHGGYVAVPDGVQIVQSGTLDGLAGKLRRMAEPEDEP